MTSTYVQAKGSGCGGFGRAAKKETPAPLPDTKNANKQERSALPHPEFNAMHPLNKPDDFPNAQGFVL